VAYNTAGFSEPRRAVGTIPYMAPEILPIKDCKRSTQMSDKYAIACLLWEVHARSITRSTYFTNCIRNRFSWTKMFSRNRISLRLD
jgi:serine/threonine protein kinase